MNHSPNLAPRLRRYIGAPLTNERGAALVITLLVVALVTILVLEYHFDAAVEMELADSYASELQAYHLAMSGLYFARAVLQRDTNQSDAADDLWALLGAANCVSPKELLALAREVGEAQEKGETPLLDTEAITAEESTRSAAESDVPASCVRIRIVDEARKLPLHALLEADGCTINETWASIFERFFEDFKLKEDEARDMVNALVDWLDTSCTTPDGALPGGAENDYYEGLEHPYTIPYRPFQVPGELRLVRHFTCDALAKLFPGKECKEVPDLDIGSNDYLTPYGGGPQEARVNINTASEAVLRALIPSETCIEKILTERGVSFEGQLLVTQARTDTNNICDEPLPAEVTATLGVRSTHFRVESVGEVGGLIQKKVVAVLARNGQGNQPGGGPQMVYFKVE